MALCDECNGHCCNRFIYLLTHKDLERIARNVKVDPLYFTNAWVGSIKSQYPTFLLQGKPHYLVLDHVPGTLRCVFAVKLNNTFRCGIHSNRPLSCRTHPFTLNDFSELDSVETTLCPKQWFPEGEEKQQYHRDIQQFRKELDEYNELVQEWNQGNTAKASFLGFLDFLAQHSIRLEAKAREKGGKEWL